MLGCLAGVMTRSCSPASLTSIDCGLAQRLIEFDRLEKLPHMTWRICLEQL